MIKSSTSTAMNTLRGRSTKSVGCASERVNQVWMRARQRSVHGRDVMRPSNRSMPLSGTTPCRCFRRKRPSGAPRAPVRPQARACSWKQHQHHRTKQGGPSTEPLHTKLLWPRAQEWDCRKLRPGSLLNRLTSTRALTCLGHFLL